MVQVTPRPTPNPSMYAVAEILTSNIRVMYFITEHSRTSGLKSETAGKTYKEITDKTLNNKFVVVRVDL